MIKLPMDDIGKAHGDAAAVDGLDLDPGGHAASLPVGLRQDRDAGAARATADMLLRTAAGDAVTRDRPDVGDGLGVAVQIVERTYLVEFRDDMVWPQEGALRMECRRSTLLRWRHDLAGVTPGK